jgi:urease accessory protein UreF
MRLTDGDTTIKLEASVVREVAEILSGRQTLTAFVREAVTRDVRRRKMRAAATLYRETLDRDPDEAAAMDAWESAPLATEPTRSTRRKP